MNANLGIVLHKTEREATLRQLPPETRIWAGEVVELDGPTRYAFQGIEGIEFRIYPLTTFMLSLLPASDRSADLEYAYMTGAALDDYESWCQNSHDEVTESPLERGLVALLLQLDFWAILFAPEWDRLGEFVALNPENAVRHLQHGVRNLWDCPGFLALKA
ncbi:hypothetical protein ACNRD9_22755 [Ralstonia pseudosolanacearum]|uniref:hypothetical protein n=1 Tax=Ralstonia pseudosolanacearum TaxID=1310165 RepID=UPI0005C70D9C|nr:hypothetical protein [Ralstonia pseudosolanacearum]MCK4150279.1 hypothetical protein [Ralstonia pseudosolanacearum]BCL90025.1 hypothetical protein MAFF211471_51130 [Ralstonia solanacearum]BCN02589.1 hypothetical protein RPSA_51250 [Ralstonia solanacearum]